MRTMARTKREGLAAAEQDERIAKLEKQTRELQQKVVLALVGVLLIGLFLVLTSVSNLASRPKADYPMTEAAPAMQADSARAEAPSSAAPCYGMEIAPLVALQAEVSQPLTSASLAPEWLASGLYGNNTEVSRLGPVTITGDAASGYRVGIRSQDEFQCGVTADADGNPSQLTNCVEATGNWIILTTSIRLNCYARPTEMVCTGPFNLAPADRRDDVCSRQIWNVTIARPR